MPDRAHSLIHETGRWQIHVGRRELLADGAPVPIGARAFEIIEVLVRSANQLVTRDALMDRIWPGAPVGDNTLQVHISAIRKALGQDRAMLQTVSGRGYRLVGRWVAADTPAPAPAIVEPVRSNLPAAAADLIGRDAAEREIHELLSAYRVVTLSGPGGIGKTALALHVCHAVDRAFSAGVWLVELAALSDPGQVASAVAGGLGLQPGPEASTPETIARAVADRTLLLVIDNCEHVIDAAADLVETLVRRCPHVRVLATSRELLRVAGEYVWQVPPLEIPPRQGTTPEHSLEHSAVQLFVAKLRQLDSSFTMHAAQVHSIAEICRHLDRIPLAIEFAAARAATLGVEHVAANLADRFRLLTGGRRNALARHQTLRATFDWSYALLPATEQRLLRRLAVFTAGFTLEAAAAVMTEPHDTAPMVLEGIANLVAKSLVTLDRSVPAGRWALLETTRAYAFEKLVESGEADAVARGPALIERGHAEPLVGIRSHLPVGHGIGDTGKPAALHNGAFSAAWTIDDRERPRLMLSDLL